MFEIRVEDKMKVELHCHTRYSDDSILSLRLLYRKCKKENIKYIAITDHNSIKGAKLFSKYCADHGGDVNVIIGEEIMTSEGEIIGLFLKEKIEPGLSVEKTIYQIKCQNGVVYVPHPYDEKRYRTVLNENAIERNKSQIDCIECHNGRNISEQYSIKQNEIADKYHLNKVIGSDAHTLLEIGRNYNEVSIEPIDKDHFLEAIKNAKHCTASCLIIAHKITKIAKMITYIQRGNYDEIFRVINRRIKH